MKNKKRIINSLFFKIPFSFIVITLIFTTVSILLIDRITYEQFRNQVEKRALLTVSSLEWAIAPLYNKKNISSIQRLLENIGSYDFIENIRLHNSEYKVISSNHLNEIGKRIQEKTVTDIIINKKLKSVEKNFDKMLFKISIPIKGSQYDTKRKSDINAVLFLTVNLKNEERIFFTFHTSFIYQNIFVFLILLILLILFIFRMIFIPLKKLSIAAASVSKGNYNSKVDIKKNDELGEFAKLFNRMLDEINKNNQLLGYYSQTLEKRVDLKAGELLKTNKKLKEAYSELKRTQAKLLQADKMASIGQLAAGVAHEINNPIGFIKSNLGTLSKYISKINSFFDDVEASFDSSELFKIHKLDFIREDIKLLVNESIEGTERVEAIVRNLKEFSHVDKGNLGRMDVNEMLENTLRVIQNEIKYKAKVKKEYGKVPLITCFPQQLNQVFLNILMNAVQAIEKEGLILIRTQKKDNSVIIDISDSGKGIKNEDLGRIFEPFFTTKDIGKGTGLGLSIVYDIVKAHKGEIEAKSEMGEGTTFIITLPIETDLEKNSN